MIALHVNIDHVATLRQARRGVEPEPVTAAGIAEMSGADGITIHLREDRRHIQDRDVKLIREVVQTRLNLEMAATSEMFRIAEEIQPDIVTLVPEKREEVTTEGGLDVISNRSVYSQWKNFKLQEYESAFSLTRIPNKSKHLLIVVLMISSCTQAVMLMLLTVMGKTASKMSIQNIIAFIRLLKWHTA